MTDNTKEPGRQLATKPGTDLTADQDILRNALSLLTEEQKSGLAAKATEQAIELQAFTQKAAIQEDFSRREALDHIDQFNALDKTGRLTRHKVTSTITTAAGSRQIESKSGAACFVATACYGDPAHDAVRSLRAYRDQVLRQSPAGRRFIAWYYRKGPRMAEVIEPFRMLKALVRALLWPVVQLAKLRLRFLRQHH